MLELKLKAAFPSSFQCANAVRALCKRSVSSLAERCSFDTSDIAVAVCLRSVSFLATCCSFDPSDLAV